MHDIIETLKPIFSEQFLWGIEIWRLILAILVIFLGFLSRRIIRAMFSGIIKKRAGKTQVQWDDDVVRLMPQPLSLVVQVLLWNLAAATLILPQEPIDIRHFVFQGLEVALAIAFLWVVFRFVDVVAFIFQRAAGRTETKLDDQAVPLIRKTLKVFLAVTVGVMVIQNLGYSVTSILASLGIGGLAMALAAKDTVANFFGSVVIFTDAPFQVGDWVQFQDVEGTVEEVGFRTTRIRRFDKAVITVPNQTFTSNPIVNYSNRNIRRIKMTVGVSYDTTAEQMDVLLERLRKLVREHPGIDQSFHMVQFTGFGESSLDILIYCFTNTADWEAFMNIREKFLLRIMEVVSELGLEIAFPTRTLYLKGDSGTELPPVS